MLQGAPSGGWNWLELVRTGWRWAPLRTAGHICANFATCGWEPLTMLIPHFVAGKHGFFGGHKSEDIRTFLSKNSKNPNKILSYSEIDSSHDKIW